MENVPVMLHCGGMNMEFIVLNLQSNWHIFNQLNIFFKCLIFIVPACFKNKKNLTNLKLYQFKLKISNDGGNLTYPEKQNKFNLPQF